MSQEAHWQEEAANYLGTLADALDRAERIARPEGVGEGALIIEMSDELARQVAGNLRGIAEGL
jgi:hypothetical protein